MFIGYTPTRALVSGSTGEIDVDLSEENRSAKAEGRQHIGNNAARVETTLFRTERYIEVKAGPVPLADRAKWREFEESTAAGETFTLDLYGSQAAPDNPILTRRKFGVIAEQRFGPLYLFYTFTVFE